jgi:predicted permease
VLTNYGAFLGTGVVLAVVTPFLFLFSYRRMRDRGPHARRMVLFLAVAGECYALGFIATAVARHITAEPGRSLAEWASLIGPLSGFALVAIVANWIFAVRRPRPPE